MITSQLEIFFDNVAASASLESPARRVMPLTGRQDVPVTLCLAGTLASDLTLALSFSESDTEAGTFAEVGKYTFTVKAGAPGFAGTVMIPRTLAKPWVKAGLTITGTVSGLTVWAGVTRDDYQPYVKGLYLDGQG